MNLTLYRINDDKNVINKTLENGLVIPINLKRDVNILFPNLVLKTIDGVELRNYNYCFIDVLQRFYFIDSVQSMNNLLWQLNLTCDVIETYKSDVLSSNAVYKISSKAGDYGVIEVDASSVVQSYSESNKAITFERSILLSTVEI